MKKPGLFEKHAQNEPRTRRRHFDRFFAVWRLGRAPFALETRWLLVAAILALQTWAGRVAIGNERPPAAVDLSRLPARCAEWISPGDSALAPELSGALKADSLLSRGYIRNAPDEAVSVFVAWYCSQQGGLRQPHSPRVCLPAWGWTALSNQEITIETSAGPVRANRYLVENRGRRMVLVYWYQTARRTIASEWLAKLEVALDSVRDHRTDAALVRVATDAPAGREAAATATATSFIRDFYPELRRVLPAVR